MTTKLLLLITITVYININALIGFRGHIIVDEQKTIINPKLYKEYR